MDAPHPIKTEASRYLGMLAAQVAEAYVAHTGPRAILLAGSAAEGVSDYFSDIDLIAYYDGRLPTDEGLALARDRAHVGAFRVRSPRANGTYVEEFTVQGVECEVLHITVATWEKQMDIVLLDLSPTSVIQKALSGLLDGVALVGEDLINEWKARASAYPEQLTWVMVEHYLSFFPLWRAHERIASRDATLWYYQALVETSHNILGVLAGLNGLYYVPFQFKRLGRFVSRMRLAPERLASRLDSLFMLDQASAASEVQRLVEETIILVEKLLPDMDTTQARRSIGERQYPWVPPE